MANTAARMRETAGCLRPTASGFAGDPGKRLALHLATFENVGVVVVHDSEKRLLQVSEQLHEFGLVR
ncbi:hypothetical protein DL237_18270 [Pseudooceanicola sediminis]|uniref:Uncharacterized protein n=1 Tax=Pseudooceanicola sediminis TaxID=2211117 RepID=A0A399J2U5_9RHOB|nr:hypothetical protein [Pseudooceanicola sediminis]KAA2312215.1 hypothetical protein E0K93_18095 [Puniceibacterium sp. HSS470]MCB1469216.1 hypothetical protein [Rhizobiaceae bacterium]RII37256.1 hypothetical protein DL237_18270 [Pseudooceanicola sediminis]|tara:strand:+ start:37562 stop:37762 length:201 start_codon:yes stop_codon:yes gene_type:complete